MAQDAVADTLLAGLQAPVAVRESERLKPWLAGVLKNKLVDQLRLYGPRAMVVADEDAVQLADESRDAGGGPEDTARFHEFLMHLGLAMDELTDQQSQCFWLRDINDADTDEICSTLGVTAGNAWVITHRARRKLQILMAQWRPDPA